jgi:four helix bundle protein
MNKSIVYKKAYGFAVDIIKLFKNLQAIQEYILSKQLLRSGTSIGANIAEANGAISEADFSSKMSIAYKEALETKYWLSLLKDTDYIDNDVFSRLFNEVDEISKMLFSILKTTRINKNSKQ